MTKKIQSATDYAVNMLNVMTKHDNAGAMVKWVDGMVKAWTMRLMSALENVNDPLWLGEQLDETTKFLIVRAIMTIPKFDERMIVFSTCLHKNIIELHHIPNDEVKHVNIKSVD